MRIDPYNSQQFDPLVQALIGRESGFNPNAVSPKGAQGLGQIMPATGRDPGFGVAPVSNPFDPSENERFTREYLAAMLQRYDGDATLGLAAYNAGPGNADKMKAAGGSFGALPMPQETQPYVTDILNQYSKATGMTNPNVTVSSRNMPEGGMPEEAPRQGVISQLMGGDFKGAMGTMFAPNENEGPKVAEARHTSTADRLRNVSQRARESMTDTNAPASWSQLIAVLGSEAGAKFSDYQANKSETEGAQELKDLMASGQNDPETIAMINALDPELGAQMAAESRNNAEWDRRMQLEFKNDLALKSIIPSKDERTALMKNAEAAGYKSGTPEYAKFMEDQLTGANNDTGLSITVGEDGSLNVLQGRGVTSGINPPDIAAGGPALGGAVSGPEAAADAAGAPPPAAPGGQLVDMDDPDNDRARIIEEGQMKDVIVPGSEADVEAKAEEERKKGVYQTELRSLDDTIRALDEAIEISNVPGAVGKSSIIDRAAGALLPGNDGQPMPGSAARAIQAQLNIVLSDEGFSRLQQMRDNSETGGALGQVTELELRLLQSTRAALDAGQDPTSFVKELSRLREIKMARLNIMKGMAQGLPEEELLKMMPNVSGEMDKPVENGPGAQTEFAVGEIYVDGNGVKARKTADGWEVIQ